MRKIVALGLLIGLGLLGPAWRFVNVPGDGVDGSASAAPHAGVTPEPSRAPAEPAKAPVAPTASSRRPDRAARANLETLLSRASDLVEAGKRDDALESLKAALAASPDDVELRQHLGELYLDVMKDPAKASDELERAYRADPGNPRALDGLVEALRRSGNIDDAIDRLTRLDRATSGRLETKLALSDVLIEAKRAREALDVLRPLQESHDPQVFDRLADAYRAVGSPREEAAALARAETLVGRYLDEKRPAPALASRIERDRALLALDRVEALAEAGDRDEALRALEGLSGRVAPETLNEMRNRIADATGR